VVVNNAFSIPFDDGGDVANEDDAVVAAAAAAAGYLLVTSKEDDEHGPGAGTPHPDSDPVRVGVGKKKNNNNNKKDPVKGYENVDNKPWKGKVLRGLRDYENAPSSAVSRGKTDCSTNRTASTSSNTQGGYENVFTSGKTVRRGVNSPGFVANKSGSVDVIAPPQLPPTDSEDDSDDEDDFNYHDNVDLAEIVPVGKTVRRGGNTANAGRTASTSSTTLEKYENVLTVQKTVHRKKRTSDGTSGAAGDGKTRKHRPGCKCGGRACKLVPVWWCATCGSGAAPKSTAAEAEACELGHQMLQASVQRQHPEMCIKADTGAAVGAGEMYSAPNNTAQTYGGVTDA
jgi:hypothetical protein